jgi:hypothetical protein
MHTVQPGQQAPAADNADGTIFMWNFTDFSVAGGDRNVFLRVRDETVRTPAVGTWRLQFTNATGTMQFNGWMVTRTVGSAAVTVTGANTERTVSMPGTARGAITVASYVTKWSWPTSAGQTFQYIGADGTANISSFSSIGPTRDGRQKPDITAPGQGIVAAISTASSPASTRIHPGGLHFIAAGTSMAAPHVAGAVALLFGARPSLTVGQIKSLLNTTADIDPFTGSVPNYIWGFGKLDIFEAMLKLLKNSASASRSVLQYDRPGGNQILTLTGIQRLALRFSPQQPGQLVGVQVNVTTPVQNPIVGSGSLVCELFTADGGQPGSRIGTPVNHPFSLLSPSTNNYVHLASSIMPVEVRDYFIVLSLSNPSDTLRLRTDDGMAPADRSMIFNGTQWARFSDSHSGLSGTLATSNLRVRPVLLSMSGITSVDAEEGVPGSFFLAQNYPNPFNPSTTIRYGVSGSGFVSLKVYDVLGREVITLVEQEQSAGAYQVQWDGVAADGSRVASGFYVYRLTSGGSIQSRTMILMK